MRSGMLQLFRGFLLAWLSLLSVLPFMVSATDEVSVVVHPTTSIEQLNRNQLRRIFSMRQSVWPDGQPIVVYVLNSEDRVNKAFCREVLQMFPYQLERQWNRLAYSGIGEPPEVVSSVNEMKLKVSTTPGAIGYLPNASLSEQDKVKVLVEVP